MAHNTLLIVAPHVRYPIRDGSSLYVERLMRALSKMGIDVDMLAHDRHVRYTTGELIHVRKIPAPSCSRMEASVRTLLSRSHHLIERHITRPYRAYATQLLGPRAHRWVLYSFCTAASLALPDDERPAFILTHNDEFAWFEALTRHRNPLARLVAQQSLRWLDDFLKTQPTSTMLLHVSEADHRGYAEAASHLRHAIVPIGADTNHVPPPPLPPRAPRLLFVGSLGVQMNYDALAHFAERYEPALQAHWGASLHVDVAGSTPLPSVQALCRQQGWHLHADVTDTVLDALYAEATAALLPFAYATGAKLKLFGALARGIPVLATRTAIPQDIQLPFPAYVGDEPEEWAAHLIALTATGVSAADRQHLSALAQTHSWQRSAGILRQLLLQTP